MVHNVSGKGAATPFINYKNSAEGTANATVGNVYTVANATTHTFALSVNGVSALDSTLFHDDIVDGSIGVVSRVGGSNEIVYVDSIANDRTIRSRDGHGFTAGDEIVLLGLHGVAGSGGARSCG